MSSLGYKEWREFFARSDEQAQTTAVMKWKYDEHAYARRQMTWLRKLDGVRWFDITTADYVREIVDGVRRWYTNRS